SMFNPLGTEIDRFKSSYESAMSQFEKTRDFRVTLTGYEKSMQDVQSLYETQQAIYEESGNPIDLQINSDDFDRIAEEHNALVKEIGAPRELEISFNNFGHVMRQMEALHGELDKIDRRNARKDIEAGAQAYNELTGENSTMKKDLREKQSAIDE